MFRKTKEMDLAAGPPWRRHGHSRSSGSNRVTVVVPSAPSSGTAPLSRSLTLTTRSRPQDRLVCMSRQSLGNDAAYSGLELACDSGPVPSNHALTRLYGLLEAGSRGRAAARRKEKHQRGPVSRVLCPAGSPPGDGHFSRAPVARRLERPYPGAPARAALPPRAELSPGAGIAPLFGLAPGGVCRADAVARAAGELLPHRFTLTARRQRRRRRQTAVCFLWRCPWGCPPWPLASTLPCGARTFLPRRIAPTPATIRPSLAQVESNVKERVGTIGV